MQLYPHARRKAAGFSLTELAIVMGVTGVILGGVWAGSANVIARHRANQAVQQISQITANVRALYQTRGALAQGGSTDLTVPMMTAQVFPSEMMATLIGGFPTNSWNGSAHIYAMNPQTFRISFYGSSAAICNQIANQIYAAQSDGARPLGLITSCGGGNIDTSSGPPDSATIDRLCRLAVPCQSVEFDYSIR